MNHSKKFSAVVLYSLAGLLLVGIGYGIRAYMEPDHSLPVTHTVASLPPPSDAGTNSSSSVVPVLEDKSASPAPNSQIKFDACGSFTRYTNQLWFGRFSASLAGQHINTEDISDSCYSLDGKWVIFIVQGGYAEPGQVFRYDVIRDSLAQAAFDGKGRGWYSSPSTFGKRSGVIIPLVGSGGDAGCGGDMYYDYDLVANTVTLKKEYTVCDNGNGPEKGEWKYY